MTGGTTPAGLRRKGRPRLEEAADIERSIRNAALKVLLEHGEAATMNAVAQAAAISRKSLYARYASKAELFIEVIREVMSEPDPIPFTTAGPIYSDLQAYIRRMLDVVADKRSVTIQRLLAVDPAYIRALKVEMRASSDRHFVQPLKDLLGRAAARGEIVPFDYDAAAKAIVHLIFAESHIFEPERITSRSANWREVYARFLTDMVCNGLLPRHPA